MINRTKYIEKILKFKDKKLIKVLTGMRRVGKSTILFLFKKYLIDNGISEGQIIYLNLEDLQYSYINDYNDLYNEIISKITTDKMYYIMIDEIQNISKFEKAIDSLFLKDNVDIYITGSNAKFLSSEIATVLTGRYVEFNVLPFTFDEYSQNENDKDASFKEFMEFGGMPFLKSLEKDRYEINKYLDSVYNTIFAKDILKRIEIRNVDTLEKIIRYLYDNISNPTSIKKITDALVSGGTNISQPTVDSYVDTLLSSYMFYKVYRYDIKGKEILTTQSKYYACDIGFRNYMYGFGIKDIGRILENIVYIHLLSNGYKVFTGKINDKEIDFVAEYMGEKKYIQVSASIMDVKTYDREIEPLRNVNDDYPKYILTLDKNVPSNTDNGIKILNVVEYLLSKDI